MGFFDKVKEFVFQTKYREEDDNFGEGKGFDPASEYEYPETDDIRHFGSSRRGGTSASDETISLSPRRNAVKEHKDKDVFAVPNSNLHITLAMPKNIDDARGISDLIAMRRTVLVNMEEAEKGQGQRIIDFLAGIAFHTKGDIVMTSTKNYLMMPEGVEFSKQGEELLRANGIGAFPKLFKGGSK